MTSAIPASVGFPNPLMEKYFFQKKRDKNKKTSSPLFKSISALSKILLKKKKFLHQGAVLTAPVIEYDAKHCTLKAEKGFTWDQKPYKLSAKKAIIAFSKAPCHTTEKYFSSKKNTQYIEKAEISGEVFGSWRSLCFYSTNIKKTKENQIALGKSSICHEKGERISSEKSHWNKGFLTLTHGTYYPYTPKTGKKPLWSLESKKIICHKKKIFYYWPKFLFFNHTILKIPFFIQPLERCSGFLSPKIGYGPSIGFYAGLPLYLAPHSWWDATFTPYIINKRCFLFSANIRAKYCENKNFGFLKTKGALSAPLSISAKNLSSGNQWGKKERNLMAIQGYGHSKWQHSFQKKYRLQVEQWWLSNSTFLYTYPFFGHKHDPYLESKNMLIHDSEAKKFSAITRNYFGLLGPYNPKLSPIVLPEIFAKRKYTMYSDHSISVSFRGLHLFQKLLQKKSENWGDQGQNPSLSRGILGLKWHYRPSQKCWRPFSIGSAVFFKGTISKQLQDIFQNTEKKRLKGGYLGHSGLEKILNKKNSLSYVGHIMPQFFIMWKNPYISTVGKKKIIFLPVVQWICGPVLKQNGEVNEDCQAIEWNKENLFAHNRYSGWDRFDDGHRINYAISGVYQGNAPIKISTHLGQSFSFTPITIPLRLLGVKKGWSPVLGGVGLSGSNGYMRYDFQIPLEKFTKKLHNGAFYRHSLELGWQCRLFRLAVSYFHSTEIPLKSKIKTSSIKKILPKQGNRLFRLPLYRPAYRQLFFTYSLFPKSQWTLSFYGIYAMDKKNLSNPSVLQKKGGFLEKGIALGYTHQSLKFNISLYRANYGYKNIKSGYGMQFSLILGHLGSIRSANSSSVAGEIYAENPLSL